MNRLKDALIAALQGALVGYVIASVITWGAIGVYAFIMQWPLDETVVRAGIAIPLGFAVVGAVGNALNN